MRDIRFRAWDKEEKVMWEVANLQLWLFAKPTKYTDGSGGPKGEWELMQYTGLKDKNGKEIWERDVVRVYQEGWETKIGWVVWHEQYARFNIAWQTDTPDFYGCLTTFANDDIEFEVIGDIYSNPELLEVKP